MAPTVALPNIPDLRQSLAADVLHDQITAVLKWLLEYFRDANIVSAPWVVATSSRIDSLVAELHHYGHLRKWTNAHLTHVQQVMSDSAQTDRQRFCVYFDAVQVMAQYIDLSPRGVGGGHEHGRMIYGVPEFCNPNRP